MTFKAIHFPVGIMPPCLYGRCSFIGNVQELRPGMMWRLDLEWGYNRCSRLEGGFPGNPRSRGPAQGERLTVVVPASGQTFSCAVRKVGSCLVSSPQSSWVALDGIRNQASG